MERPKIVFLTGRFGPYNAEAELREPRRRYLPHTLSGAQHESPQRAVN